jgi:hypothetical protein
MIAQQKFELSLTSGHAVTLANGSTMSAADILGLSGNNPEGAFAEVDRNPNDPLVLGLKNLTTKAWSASIAGGARRQIEPDRSIRLAADTEVSFGCVIGTIRQRANGSS